MKHWPWLAALVACGGPTTPPVGSDGGSRLDDTDYIPDYGAPPVEGTYALTIEQAATNILLPMQFRRTPGSDDASIRVLHDGDLSEPEDALDWVTAIGSPSLRMTIPATHNELEAPLSLSLSLEVRWYDRLGRWCGEVTYGHLRDADRALIDVDMEDATFAAEPWDSRRTPPRSSCSDLLGQEGPNAYGGSP